MSLWSVVYNWIMIKSTLMTEIASLNEAFLSCPHLVWVLLIPAAVSSLRLTSYPDEAMQGEGFTLSCVNDYDLSEMRWIVNNDPVFKTKLGILVPEVTGNVQSYFITSGRLSVSTSSKQHNVTFRINSTLDDGSVVECDVGGIFSNNLTIHVMQHTTDVQSNNTITLTTEQNGVHSDKPISSTAGLSTEQNDVQSKKTITLTAGLSTEENGVHSDITSSLTAGLSTEPNDKNLIYIVIGSVGGAVVVSVIIVTVVCVIRKKRNQTAQTKCPTPKEHSSFHEEEDVVDNSEMIDNVLYCGYSDPQYSTDEENRSNEDNKAQTSDETRVTDVYAQVQKKKNQTKVQVTVNIEDLYAKPVRKKSKDTANISVNNNVNINIGNIADESV